jgi:hypothetical protein
VSRALSSDLRPVVVCVLKHIKIEKKRLKTKFNRLYDIRRCVGAVYVFFPFPSVRSNF